MAKPTRSDDWGFPRWRPYGAKGRSAARVRLCDREGCSEVGDRPAPKAPHSGERWMFCEAHAAEYNRNWNYFAGLPPKKRRAVPPKRKAAPSAYRSSAHYAHGAGPGDGSRSRDEMRALEALELEIGRRFQGGEGGLSSPRQGTSPRSPQGRQGSGEAFPRDPGGL